MSRLSAPRIQLSGEAGRMERYIKAVRRAGGEPVPGYAPEPEQKPVCRQFSRCEGCPYPAHGFLCWGGEDDCMRTRVKKLNEKELEHEDQSGFV